MRTPVSRVKLSRKPARRISEGGRSNRSSPNKLCEKTDNLQIRHDSRRPSFNNSSQCKVKNSPQRRSLRKSQMTPTRVSSSQAPMSGRDVFWEYDTPESRRARSKIAAQMETLRDSPRSKPGETIAQLRLFKPKNKSKSSASVEEQHVGVVLEDLSKLNAEIFKSKEEKDLSEHEESRPETSIAPTVKKEETIATDETNAEEEDMFGDSDPFADDLGFEEDDNDFLVAASQAAEEENFKPPIPVGSSEQVKTKMMFPPSTSFASSSASSSSATEPKPQTSSASVKIEDPDLDFGGDDSFEDLLSQIETEQAKPPLLQQPEVKPSPAPSLQQNKPIGASSNQKSAANSLKRNCSSFQSPPSKKIVVQKFQSDSRIEVRTKVPEAKPICSKDEIERKKKEALERRKVSQSQKRVI